MRRREILLSKGWLQSVAGFAGHVVAVRGAFRDRTLFLCIAESKKEGQRNLRPALVRVATEHPRAASDRPYLRHILPQRSVAFGVRPQAEDYGAGSCRPARREAPFELRGRAQNAPFAPRYPLPSPAGDTFFYPTCAIKEAKPRPPSLSWGHKEGGTQEKASCTFRRSSQSDWALYGESCGGGRPLLPFTIQRPAGSVFRQPQERLRFTPATGLA